MLQNYFQDVSGDGEVAHPHSNWSPDPGGRTRLGGRCRPSGRRTSVG
jgi:hypothetical protein